MSALISTDAYFRHKADYGRDFCELLLRFKSYRTQKTFKAICCLYRRKNKMVIACGAVLYIII